ncbi:hypothetical protein BD410DRAFT_429191 [Rickenella mellea]|uniref:Uncharacterized protein n=1 Tax=Rickenella mellea TaxID=50990 RepID=A0A4Y7QIX4_9AGAM|nr:hypothetical protein BD410DRAFT_429191 [Rickenella mellea]
MLPVCPRGIVQGLPTTHQGTSNISSDPSNAETTTPASIKFVTGGDDSVPHLPRARGEDPAGDFRRHSSPSLMAPMDRTSPSTSRALIGQKSGVPAVTNESPRLERLQQDKATVRVSIADTLEVAGQKALTSPIVPKSRIKSAMKSTNHDLLFRPDNHKEQPTKRNAEPGMEGIIEVLNAIQDVVISNVAKKSEYVKADVRIARNKLFHDAAADLRVMHEESVKHFNNLLSLETKYASVNRQLALGFEDIGKISKEVCEEIQQTVKEHDRSTSSNKMPKSLFPSSMPAIFK